MSITDELRKYVQSWRETPNLMDELDAGDIDGLLGDFIAIADRIDAEAEDNERFRREAEPFCDRLREASAERADVTLFGVDYMALPADADGVPIRVGDKVVDWDTPRLVVAVSEDSICLAGYESDSYYRMGIAKNYRHHHEPTVEDVLRGVVTLCRNTWKEGSAFEFYDVDDVMKSGNIADFSAKLRLAGDAE